MRRKRHRKNSKKYIILPAIFLLFLFSAGYSAFSAEFLISGKGTIIEKGTVSIGGVNVKTVTTGSGLYKSEYEEGKYIYRGASPDNYITLGEDEYRVISKETDGTLKVIRSEKIGDFVFDTSRKRYLNHTLAYCNSKDGCKVWGSSSTMLDSTGNNVTTMPRVIGSTEYNLPDEEAYLNTYLNTTWYNSLSSTVQNVITTHLFNVGLVDEGETNLATTLSTEKAYKWSGKIGLLNVSDYVLANNNTNCSSVNDHYRGNNEVCYSTNSTDNWLYKNIMTNPSSPWIVSPISDSHEEFSMLVSYSSGALDASTSTSSYGALPVFYLKSDVKLSGTGKSSDPFILSA